MEHGFLFRDVLTYCINNTCLLNITGLWSRKVENERDLRPIHSPDTSYTKWSLLGSTLTKMAPNIQYSLWQVCAKLPSFLDHAHNCMSRHETFTARSISDCNFWKKRAARKDRRYKTLSVASYGCTMTKGKDLQTVHNMYVSCTHNLRLKYKWHIVLLRQKVGKFTHFTHYIIQYVSCISIMFRVHFPQWTFQYMSKGYQACLHLTCWLSPWQTDSVGAIALLAICWQLRSWVQREWKFTVDGRGSAAGSEGDLVG